MESQNSGNITELIESNQVQVPPSAFKICCGEAPCILSVDAKTKDALERKTSIRKLIMAIILCIIFITVEVIGGIKANSLAILTDAAHLLTDLLAFAISLFAIWASAWETTPRRSYGFYRIEILGGLVSVLIIWLLAANIVYQAIARLIHNTATQVNGILMFSVAAIGFVVNIAMALLLGHGHGHNHDEPTIQNDGQKRRRNINIQGAYLHVIGDAIQSVGVMVGGAVIWWRPEWKIIDVICTLVFSVIVMWTTVRMLRKILEVLMEGTPREVDAAGLEKGLLEMEEVVAIHELHIWAITVGKILLTCHVKVRRDEADTDLVLDKVVDYIRTQYHINHVTIQIERE